MSALYQIADEYVSLFNALSEDGFDKETIENTLAHLSGDFQEKAKNISFWIRNLESDIDQFETHQEDIKKRIRKKKDQVSFWRDYIKNNMIKMNIKLIKCPIFNITIKKSTPKLIKEDEMIIPSEYIKTKIVTEIDDRMLKNDLIEGKLVSGAFLQESHALTIKLK